MPTYFLPLKPNAGYQARREAEAERKLYAVACMPFVRLCLTYHATTVVVFRTLVAYSDAFAPDWDCAKKLRD